MVLFGFLTRIVSVPLLVIMITALIITKIPILLNKGFWQMTHDSRTDFAMTMLLIFLIIYGAGRFSVDERLKKKKSGTANLREIRFRYSINYLNT